MPKIKIDCNVKSNGFNRVTKAVYKTLNQKIKFGFELLFVSAEKIKELNRDTRNIDSVTDVLSYPSMENIKGKILKKEDCITELEGKRVFLGSIVMCKEKIAEQAKELNHAESIETTYLLVHGLMHLFGYDHLTEEDKKEMREKEKTALKLLGRED